MQRHVRNAHANTWTCIKCAKTYNREDNFHHHQRLCAHLTTGAPVQVSTTQTQAGTGLAAVNRKRRRPARSAFNRTSQDFELDLSTKPQSPVNFMNLLKDSIQQHKRTLMVEREEKKAVKFSFTLQLLFHQLSDQTLLTDPAVSINSTSRELYEADDIDELLNSTLEELFKRIDTFESKGSGWVIHKLLNLVLHVDHLVPLRASSYIPTPLYIAAKKAVVNVKNADNACFMWAYLSATHPVDHSSHPERVNKYKQHQSELNMRGIDLPMALKDIPKFERQNNCSISVYGFEEKFHQDAEEQEIKIHFIIS